MVNIIIDAVINGAVIYGVLGTIWDAKELFKNNSTYSAGVVYDTTHSRVDLESETVTYDSLPMEDEERIENLVDTVISGIILIGALFFEFVVDSELQIQLIHRTIYALVMGFIIWFISRILKKIVAFLIIKIVNVYAKHKGLVKELPSEVYKEY